MPKSEPGTAWRDLPAGLRAEARRAGRAGVLPADPAVQDAMIARHHAWLRRGKWLSGLVLVPVPVVLATTSLTGGPGQHWTDLAVTLALLVFGAVVMGTEVAGARWARIAAPARVAAALRDTRGAVPTSARQAGIGSPFIGLLLPAVPVVYLYLMIDSVLMERELQAEVAPGEPFDWGAVRGWAVVWAVTLLVPALISLVQVYRLQPFDRGPAARVDESGVWIRRLRVTVPWTEVVGLHAVGPGRRDGMGLAVQVRDPDRIVALSTYPPRLRRYLLWGLRGGNPWIVVDDRLLREPADGLLAAALAYQATHPPVAEPAAQGGWGWW
ncbi:hypothetical protein ACFQZ4_30830 [Catellatospora coxensis]|uniref:Uncharacterized protein n=1 Tax=Catellatospora coxensis TaxID=310354 RepID=A0A8J3P9W7_9ACTN|nr:hypothetical protein [Catellatospora coxensis]GIG07226.1 hypothetical protein Cco03nite_39260 [Catellatospora coxensis]